MKKKSISAFRILTRLKCRRVLFSGALLMAIVMLSAGGAMALPAPQPFSPFDITGFIDDATLSVPGDALAGGTITVDGQIVTVPRNIVVLMPANALTWQGLFTLAPPPYGPSQTGLAALDVPKPLTTYQAHITGNRVGDQYIAGTIAIFSDSLNSGAGFINWIDYVNGEIRVGGVINDPTTGARVRLNDPIGRFGRVISPDPRFTIDEDNPTVRTATGFPMCLPRTDPQVSIDPLCPEGNRPAAGTNPNFAAAMTFPDPATIGSTNPLLPDPRIQMPLEIGDYVTYSGIMVTDNAAAPTASTSFTTLAATYISAWAITTNLAVYTAPGTDPAYVAIDVQLLGVGGANQLAIAEATARTRFEGFTTDPTRTNITLWGIDVDPCTGALTDRAWGAVDIDPGPPNGAQMGRWRFRPPYSNPLPPGVVYPPPSNGGTFLPPTLNLRAVVPGATQIIAANGLKTGQYFAPFFEYLFPENVVGAAMVPANYETFPFLTQGSGPLPGGLPGQIVGRLDPWPGDITLLPSPPVCGLAPAPVRGDFNADGQIDLLWRNKVTGANIVWFMNGPTWTGNFASITTVADPNWIIAGVADFDRSGQTDLLWRNTSTGANVVWFMNGTTWTGNFAPVTTVADPNWIIAGVADFNADGLEDLLWRNTSTGDNVVWFMNGTTWTGNFANITAVADPNWIIAGVADFNTDGNPDILWRNTSTGVNVVWFMNGTTWTGNFAPVTTVADSNWIVAKVADFNADGNPDILWRNTSTGVNVIWFMTGTTWAGSYAVLPTVPVPDWSIAGQ